MNVKALKPIHDPANWRGDELADSNSWLFELGMAERESLYAMADAVLEQISEPADLLAIDKSQVRLGAFAATLKSVWRELKRGSGVALIRGLVPDQVSPLKLATIYWGIGLHLGEAQANNPQGDMIGHVTDLGKTQSDPSSRGYQTREAMDYHCDQADIVGLLCVRTAKQGGLSKIASSVAMYNTLLTRYPELAESLASELYWTKHGEHAPDEKPYYTSPVFNFDSGEICTSFGPKHIYKGHQLPGVPEITDQQKRAIETTETIAEELHLSMALEPGDMQFLNNYTVVHTRTAYEDHDDPAQKRLLWRLWLMNDALRGRTDYSRQWQKGVSLNGVVKNIVI